MLLFTKVHGIWPKHAILSKNCFEQAEQLRQYPSTIINSEKDERLPVTDISIGPSGGQFSGSPKVGDSFSHIFTKVSLGLVVNHPCRMIPGRSFNMAMLVPWKDQLVGSDSWSDPWKSRRCGPLPWILLQMGNPLAFSQISLWKAPELGISRDLFDRKLSAWQTNAICPDKRFIALINIC